MVPIWNAMFATAKARNKFFQLVQTKGTLQRGLLSSNDSFVFNCRIHSITNKSWQCDKWPISAEDPAWNPIWLMVLHLPRFLLEWLVQSWLQGKCATYWITSSASWSTLGFPWRAPKCIWPRPTLFSLWEQTRSQPEAVMAAGHITHWGCLVMYLYERRPYCIKCLKLVLHILFVNCFVSLSEWKELHMYKILRLNGVYITCMYTLR